MSSIVISGGGAKCIAILGAIQKLYDEGNFLSPKGNEFTDYVGTSAGSMISYLLIIGFTPIEVLIDICSSGVMDNLTLNMIGAATGEGLIKWDIIHNFLRDCTLKKLQTVPNFQQLYDQTGKKLHCVTWNNTKQQKEVLNVDNTPELDVLFAIRMSCALPLIFSRLKVETDEYVDGGITENCPVSVGEKISGEDTRIFTIINKLSTSPDDSVPSFIISLLRTLVKSNTHRSIDHATGVVHKVPSCGYSVVNFNIPVEMRMKLFTEGFESVE